VRAAEGGGKKKYSESLANDSSFMPVSSVRAAVEVLSVSNGALHGEVGATPTIHPNRLVRNEHSYESTETHLS
jgi:hypothetical protein